MPKCFTIQGYCHLYRSLLRFLPIDPFEAGELVFRLNTANIDTCRAAYPDHEYRESSAVDFLYRLNHSTARPYFAEVQLFKSIEALQGNIRWSAITETQRDALLRLIVLTHTLRSRFHVIHGCEIDDPETVFGQCRSELIPGRDEPTTCLKGSERIVVLAPLHITINAVPKKNQGKPA